MRLSQNFSLIRVAGLLTLIAIVSFCGTLFSPIGSLHDALGQYVEAVICNLVMVAVGIWGFIGVGRLMLLVKDQLRHSTAPAMRLARQTVRLRDIVARSVKDARQSHLLRNLWSVISAVSWCGMVFCFLLGGPYEKLYEPSVIVLWLTSAAVLLCILYADRKFPRSGVKRQ